MKFPTFSTLEDACHYCGILPPNRHGNGFIPTDTVEHHRGKKAGRVAFFKDGKGGYAKNWRNGLEALFLYGYKQGVRIPLEEWRKRKAELEQLKAEGEALKRVTREAVARLAGLILEAAHPSSVPHPYLLRKHVSNVQGAPMMELDCVELYRIAKANEMPMPDGIPQRLGYLRGRLLVLPLTLDSSTPTSLQIIDASGRRKTFLKGGLKKGTLWRPAGVPVVSDEIERIGIAEGVATALSVRQLFGVPCLSGIDAGNLIHAVKTARACYPRARILLFADRDASGVGEEEARKASRAVDRSELYICPEFTAADRAVFKKLTGGDKPSDFNDLMIIKEGF